MNATVKVKGLNCPMIQRISCATKDETRWWACSVYDWSDDKERLPAAMGFGVCNGPCEICFDWNIPNANRQRSVQHFLVAHFGTVGILLSRAIKQTQKGLGHHFWELFHALRIYMLRRDFNASQSHQNERKWFFCVNDHGRIKSALKRKLDGFPGIHAMILTM